MSTPSSQAPDLSVRRVLAVKTSSPVYFESALSRARALFPNASLAVWTEERHSEEYFGRQDVRRVILYRNLPSIPAMLAEIRDFDTQVVVTQRTFEPDYDKMQVLALALVRASGVVVDNAGEVCAGGTWRRRLRSFVGSVVYRTTARSNLPDVRLPSAFGILGVFRLFAQVIAAPVVLITLLVNVGVIEIRRRRYLRSRGASSR